MHSCSSPMALILFVAVVVAKVAIGATVVLVIVKYAVLGARSEVAGMQLRNQSGGQPKTEQNGTDSVLKGRRL